MCCCIHMEWPICVKNMWMDMEVPWVRCLNQARRQHQHTTLRTVQNMMNSAFRANPQHIVHSIMQTLKSIFYWVVSGKSKIKQ